MAEHDDDVEYERDPRKAALKRLKAKRDFRTHVAAYVVVNLALIGIWWFTGRGFYWPIFVILGWGIGVALNGWDVYFRKPITEAQIDREIRRSA